MGKKTVLYRGNLKSCNYRCSYCPFSKRKALASELEKDKRNFQRFCDSIEERAEVLSIGAVFVVPYGEAAIHSWYWQGLGRLAGISGIDKVGIQTNLSFPIEECMELFDQGHWDACGIDEPCSRAKLCIWATFHPEMTDVDTFAEKCHRLAEKGAGLCAGAVGVPQNIPLLRRLRETLSPDIYLWINKMDGLGRNYTMEEREAFLEIDPFFEYELGNPVADASMCGDRCFVEADGKIHACNISMMKETNWYDGSEEEIFQSLCGRKRCTCYLAYGGKADFQGKPFFGDYPIFRIPRKFQAVFLDLDGTMVPEGHRGGLSEKTRERLEELSKIGPIFLATSMPMEEAVKRIKGDMRLFHGGVFASGAQICLKQEEGFREEVYPVNMEKMSEISRFAKDSRGILKIYRKNDIAYKITLIKEHGHSWDDSERGRMAQILEDSGCRFFTEGNCLEIVDGAVNKGTGIKVICGWMGIAPEDVLAVGNDREDAAMEKVCGAYKRAR